MSAPTPDTDRETAFAEALGAAAEEYRIDPGALADLGWQRGRHLRRRRRAALLGGATCAAALALGIGLLAPPVGTGPGPGPGFGPGSGSGSGSVGTGPAAGPPIGGAEFRDLLTELLPAGQLVETGEARGTESGIPQLRLIWDDGHGQAQYLFWIMKHGAPSGCRPATPAGDACEQRTLADGTEVTLYRAGTGDGEPAGSKTWSATATTPDGYQLMLQEWNRRPLDQGAPVTRVDPPLTTDRLAAVVADPRWKRVEQAIRDIRVEVRPSGTVTRTYG
ncbi:hypothetical protein AB0O31_13920 [Kitasatospora cineracea]|uniref:hypothetical protein n=1 Tax=Kitasatospora cineracea TaxID=88074 RepID=UPI00341F541D